MRVCGEINVRLITDYRVTTRKRLYKGSLYRSNNLYLSISWSLIGRRFITDPTERENLVSGNRSYRDYVPRHNIIHVISLCLRCTELERYRIATKDTANVYRWFRHRSTVFRAQTLFHSEFRNWKHMRARVIFNVPGSEFFYWICHCDFEKGAELIAILNKRWIERDCRSAAVKIVKKTN